MLCKRHIERLVSYQTDLMDFLRSSKYIVLVLIITYYHIDRSGISKMNRIDAFKYYKGISLYLYI